AVLCCLGRVDKPAGRIRQGAQVSRIKASSSSIRLRSVPFLSGLFLRLAERVGCVRLIPEPHPPRCALRASHSAVQIRSSRICRTRVGSSTHPLRQPRKKPLSGLFLRLAERVGFEPTVRYKPTPRSVEPTSE